MAKEKKFKVGCFKKGQQSTGRFWTGLSFAQSRKFKDESLGTVPRDKSFFISSVEENQFVEGTVYTVTESEFMYLLHGDSLE